MKKLFTLIAVFLLASAISVAQYSTDWIRPAETFNKTGTMIARDNLDNVIVTGKIISSNIYTRKYDKFGNFLWEQISSSGISGNYETSFWVNTDFENNVLVTGYQYAGTSNQLPIAIVAIKYNAAGTLLWKQILPISNIYLTGIRSEVDNNGNLYIGTQAATPSAGFQLYKLSPDGSVLFYRNNSLNGINGFTSMRLKGNKVVMSGSSGTLSAAPIVSWDTDGNLLWTASLLGRSAKDVEIDDAGNVYMLTSYDNQVTASSGQDILIYKFDAAGTQLWVKNFDFGGQDFPTRFTFVGNKLSIIGYGSNSASYFDWITFQLDADGNMLWNVRYDETTSNDEQSHFIVAKPNGEVFVTGRGGPLHNQFGNGYLRMITTKYDNTGIRKWVDSVNVNSGMGVACTLSSDGSLYVLSDAYMTAFHFLDHTGGVPAVVPTLLNASNIGSTYATFSWTAVPDAYLYHLRYKKTTDMIWTVASIDMPIITINGLTDATTYEYACEAINSGGPSGFSTTQMFTTGTALPINGIDLNVKRQGINVLIKWSTQSEQNSSYFDIERSFDGLSFLSIGRVQAAGNSTSIQTYSLLDRNTENRLIYYRLKMIDIDAAFKYSPVRIVSKTESTGTFEIFPNPATINATIVLNEAAKEELHLSIINQLGQLVLTKQISKGTQLINLDLQTLNPGIYALSISAHNLLWTKSIVIK